MLKNGFSLQTADILSKSFFTGYQYIGITDSSFYKRLPVFQLLFNITKHNASKRSSRRLLWRLARN